MESETVMLWLIVISFGVGTFLAINPSTSTGHEWYTQIMWNSVFLIGLGTLILMPILISESKSALNSI